MVNKWTDLCKFLWAFEPLNFGKSTKNVKKFCKFQDYFYERWPCQRMPGVNNKLDCFGAIWNDYCRHKPRNSASICPTTKSRNRKQPLIYCWFEGWTLTIKEFIFFCSCPFFKDREGKSVFIVKTLLNTFVPISSFFHGFIQSKKPYIYFAFC